MRMASKQIVVGMMVAMVLGASDSYPPPRFTDPDRVQKLASALPEIDRIFEAYARDKKIPGMVWGVVIDGRLASVGTFGVRDLASKEPVTANTAFRIASMNEKLYCAGDSQVAR